MTRRTSFLKRCLAMAVALVLMISNAAPGLAVRASAAEVKLSKLIVDNYPELTDAELALLNSGCLNGDVTYTDTVPAEDWVSVNFDDKEITADSADGWIPAVASIIAEGEEKETVFFEGSNTVKHTYEGNAYAVKVLYELYTEVATADQQAMLDVGYALKDGAANIEILRDANSSLNLLEAAIPALMPYAEDGYYINGQDAVPEEAKTAIKAVNAEMEENGGKLIMTNLLKEYSSLTETLVENGSEIMAKLELAEGTTMYHVETIWAFSDLMLTYKKLDPDMPSDLFDNAETLYESLTLWMDARDEVDGVDLSVPNAGLINSYAEMDAYVADLGDSATQLTKENLFVTDASVQANLNMTDVTVKVVLKKVENAVDSDKLETAASEEIKLTLSQKLSADEIKAAIEAAVDEADDIVTDTDNYKVYKTSDMPESLTDEAVEYTVTYRPVKYTVTTNYDGEKELYYGYQLALPVHSDVTKAYDYLIGEETYAQGSVYTVQGDAEITQTAGEAYEAPKSLYAIVADNFGNDAAKAILTSGALDGDTIISVRMPKTKNAAELMKMTGDTLEIREEGKVFKSSYADLYWTPYSYGTDIENPENTFGGATSVEFTTDPAYVKYILNLTNIDTAEVQRILDLAVALKEEADGQVSTMNGFLNHKDTMGQLTEGRLAALNGVVNVTKFELADSAEYFKNIIDQIMNHHMNGDNLKLYAMMNGYANGGLTYYYNNAETIIEEINALSGYMADMTARKNDLAALLAKADFPEYIEKIESMETILADVKNNLTAPNAAIELDSENLLNLVKALTESGAVSVEAAGTPWILSDTITVSGKYLVEVTVKIGSASQPYNKTGIEGGDQLTSAIVDELNAKIDAFAENQLGAAYVPYYTVSATNEDGESIKNLEERIGDVVDENIYIYYTYTPTVFNKVEVEGNANAEVTIENRIVKLPAHASEDYRYDYTLDGVKKEQNEHFELTDAQMAALLNGETLKVSRTEVELKAEKLENNLGALADKNPTNDPAQMSYVVERDEANKINGLVAKVPANKQSIMAFAEDILGLGYSYIGFNGEPFMYKVGNDLEICAETLVKAILADTTFGSDTIINLGTKGKGEFLITNMQVGNSADEIDYEALNFKLELKSVPAQMTNVAKALNVLKNRNWMTFQSAGDHMSVMLNLPEKVYEVYLTAMLATSKLDKTDMNAVNNAIAYEFLCDYLNVLMEDDVTGTTFENTLNRMGITIDSIGDTGIGTDDLSNYNDWIAKAKKVLKSDRVEIDYAGTDGYDIDVTGSGSAVLKLVDMLGVDLSSYDAYTGMVKEIKNDSDVTVKTIATLGNLNTEYAALVLDLDDAISNITGKDLDATAAMFNYTADVAGAAAGIEERGAIILLADVEGNLDIPGTAIVDLNGKTVTGQIISTSGNVYVVDSCLGAAKCGEVTGGVSGNVTVMGGKYPAGLGAKFMPDFYVQDAASGVVRNALYELKAGNVSSYGIELSKEFFTKENLKHYGLQAATVAADVAIDIALNFYDSSALKVNDYTLMAVNYADILDLIDGKKGTLANIFDETLNDIYFEDDGISGLANEIIKDLLAWDKIIDSIETGSTINTYTAVASPWKIQIDHVEDGDYLTVGLVTDSETVAHDASVTLYVPASVGEQIPESVVKALKELDRITPTKEAEIHLTQPVREGKDLLVGGTAEANFEVDLTATVYKHLLAIALANGNPEVSEDLLASMDDDDAMKAIVNKMNVKDVLESVAALDTKTIDKMCEELGTSVDSIVEKIESKFDVKITDEHINNVLEILAAGTNKVLNWLDGHEILTKTMGGIEIDNSGTYGFVDASAFRDGRKEKWGFGVQYDLAITEATLKVHVFGEAPKTEEENRGYLFLDLHPLNGMTLEELESKYVIEDLSDYELAMEHFTEKGVAKARTEKVVTGDLLKVTATKSTTTRIINYVIVVMGDTNSNGRIDSGDANRMCRMFMADKAGTLEVEFDKEAQRLAADCNVNDRIDSGDANRNTLKYIEISTARAIHGAGSVGEHEAWMKWIEAHNKGFVVK